MSGSGGVSASNQSSGGGGASSHLPPPPPPKILLAKPSLVNAAGKLIRAADDESVTLRSRVPSSFLTDNTDFTVVGVIGPPGVGKSTILNELYGFDGTSPGMLPPFAIQSEETRAMAKHCTVGIEPRISAERIILLDTQPVFSPSVLAEIIRPDGTSTISVLSGDSLSAELAHELMSIQVDLLKHGLPDPSSPAVPTSQTSTLSSEKENRDKIQEAGQEYTAAQNVMSSSSLPKATKSIVSLVCRLRDQDLTPHNFVKIKKALTQYFSSSSFTAAKNQNTGKDNQFSSVSLVNQGNNPDSLSLDLFLIPYKSKDDFPRAELESYVSALWKLRDQVLSMSSPSFARTVSERDWLKNSAKIWDMVKNSSIISEYGKTLQSSGMFRR
ncbi:hypothetical protein RHSIM_Rhsim03G0221300 [Rhododendron simsii]|uniref:Uncharacterized protein n=1 Tax=Rhododendron simsii TaxID=118357 RepID=A0A834LVI3_RHOSS|nr:hypothetical protein RHSIM_Rhsim03G0221300 [Rhododendron simsii]